MRSARALLIAIACALPAISVAQTLPGPLEGLPDRAPAPGIESDPRPGQPIVIQAGRLYTQTKNAEGQWNAPIENGVIVIQDGKITAVGASGAVTIPDDAHRIAAPIVTPGLIDARSVVGLAGWLNYDHDQDQLESSEPMQPELRAIDAFNGREPLIEWIRSFGVTTVHTGHAPGQLISGQTMIVKTRTGEVDDVVINPWFGIAATLGDSALASDRGKSPGTRAKQLAILRQALIDAQTYGEKVAKAEAEGESPPKRHLRHEAFLKLLDREVPLIVNCHRSVDLQNAMRLSQEFNFKLILEGAAEAYDHLDAIRDAQIPVFAHAPMARATGEAENASMTTYAKLVEAGIACALESGYEGYVPKTRVVLYEAAIACAYGASFQDALGGITLSAAQILGIADRVGSIEVGKDADVALYDGDPFEYTTHCIGVLIEGAIVSRIVR